MKHIYETFWDEENHRIIECQTCGFKHLYPIPNMEELKRYYSNQYQLEVKPFPYRDTPNEHWEAWAMNHSHFKEIFRKILEFKNTSVSRMVDIGCGYKLLSKFFLNHGWEATAIEPGQDAGDFLRGFGITVYTSTIEEIDLAVLKDVSFVNIEFVLEHLADPYQVLQKIFEVLAPGGIVRVAVPNDFSLGQMVYTEYYNEHFHWVNYPDHINYFTFESLCNLLKKVGLKEIYRITDFPLEFLLMSGVNYYASETEQKKVGPIVADFEASLKKTGRTDFLKTLYENLAHLGSGRSIFIYAIKE